MARAGVEMTTAFTREMATGEELDLRWLGPGLIGEKVERSARWAEDVKALPSRGRGSAGGGPLHGKHIDELRAEGETESWGVKHKGR